jgi:hypothetical protein
MKLMSYLLPIFDGSVFMDGENVVGRIVPIEEDDAFEGFTFERQREKHYSDGTSDVFKETITAICTIQWWKWKDKREYPANYIVVVDGYPYEGYYEIGTREELILDWERVGSLASDPDTFIHTIIWDNEAQSHLPLLKLTPSNKKADLEKMIERLEKWGENMDVWSGSTYFSDDLEKMIERLRMWGCYGPMRGRPLLKWRKEVEEQGLVVYPTNDDTIAVFKHPDGPIIYYNGEEFIWNSYTTTLGLFVLEAAFEEWRWLVDEDDLGLYFPLADAPVWRIAPPERSAYFKDNLPNVQEIKYSIVKQVSDDIELVHSLLKRLCNGALRGFPSFKGASSATVRTILNHLENIDWKHEFSEEYVTYYNLPQEDLLGELED